MGMLRFDWLDCVVKLGTPVSAVWFDSHGVEMTKAEHYMYLMKLCKLLECQYYSSGELKFKLGTYTFVSSF